MQSLFIYPASAMNRDPLKVLYNKGELTTRNALEYVLVYVVFFFLFRQKKNDAICFSDTSEMLAIKRLH